MNAGARRRRGFLLLALAVASGALAASEVRERARAVEAQVGPLVAVAVAKRDLREGTVIGAREALELVGTARIPARFVPPGALRRPADAVGGTAAIDVARGSYLTRAALAGGATRAPLRRGERAIDVEVSGGRRLRELGGRGALVDVVVTSEPRSGPARAFVAADGAELLALRRDGGGKAVATLRVPLRDAVYLTAATSFGRDARLLVRSPGDRSRAGRLAYAAPGL